MRLLTATGMISLHPFIATLPNVTFKRFKNLTLNYTRIEMCAAYRANMGGVPDWEVLFHFNCAMHERVQCIGVFCLQKL